MYVCQLSLLQLQKIYSYIALKKKLETIQSVMQLRAIIFQQYWPIQKHSLHTELSDSLIQVIYYRRV